MYIDIDIENHLLNKVIDLKIFQVLLVKIIVVVLFIISVCFKFEFIRILWPDYKSRFLKRVFLTDRQNDRNRYTILARIFISMSYKM